MSADGVGSLLDKAIRLEADNDRLRLEIEERRKHTATMMLVAEDGTASAIADLAERSGLAAFAEMVRDGKWRQRCRDCGNSIDPETCQCGSSREHDAAHEGHSFVPMGCDCNRADWPTLSKGETMSTDKDDDGYLAYCAELGRRHIGHPDNPEQMRLDAATKPLHVEIERLQAEVDRLRDERDAFANEAIRLEALINTPRTDDGCQAYLHAVLGAALRRHEKTVRADEVAVWVAEAGARGDVLAHFCAVITDKAIRLEAENRHLRIEIGELHHEMEVQEDRVVLSIADWLRASNQVALAGQVQSGAWQPIHDCGHVRGHEQDDCPCCELGSK